MNPFWENLFILFSVCNNYFFSRSSLGKNNNKIQNIINTYDDLPDVTFHPNQFQFELLPVDSAVFLNLVSKNFRLLQMTYLNGTLYYLLIKKKNNFCLNFFYNLVHMCMAYELFNVIFTFIN